ncbi:MAG: DUF4190 domain-containing protein [Pirellulales bacterium]
MSEGTKACPVCGEEILAVARKCRFCGEYLDQDARRQARVPASTATRLLAPMDLPGSALAAGYLGLGALFPLIGFPLGIIGIACGVKAIKEINRDATLHGKGRAWFGIIAGALGVVVWGLMGVMLIIGLIIESQRQR